MSAIPLPVVKRQFPFKRVLALGDIAAIVNRMCPSRKIHRQTSGFGLKRGNDIVFDVNDAFCCVFSVVEAVFGLALKRKPRLNIENTRNASLTIKDKSFTTFQSTT